MRMLAAFWSRLLAVVLPDQGSRRIVRGIRRAFLERTMDEQTNQIDQGLACRDPQEATGEKEREYRERVRASVERVRSQNREILDRLATK
jgi:hypothetical protein